MSSRATRSRFSSPFVSAPRDSTNESVDQNQNGIDVPQRSSQEGWQEPPIPQAKPSFAEAGMERHGVVANMAALGTRPSAKVLKSIARAEALDGTGRRSGRETSVASTPAESLANATPEPTQTPEVVATPNASDTFDAPAEIEQIDEEVVLADGREPSAAAEGIVPSTPEQPLPSYESRMSLPAQSPVGSNGPLSGFPLRPSSEPYTGSQGFVNNGLGINGFTLGPSPFPTYVSTIPRAPAAPIIRPLPEIGPDGEFVTDQVLTENVVEEAVQTALDNQRTPTAYALRMLYDTKKHHKPSLRLMEAVYGNYATPEQLLDFERELTKLKREGKKGRTAEYYFYGDSNDMPSGRRSSYLSPTVMPAFTPPIFNSPGFQQTTTQQYRTPYSPLVSSGPASASFPLSDATTTRRRSRSASPSGVQDDEDDGGPPSKKLKSNNFDESHMEVDDGAVSNGVAPVTANGSGPSHESQPNGTSKSPEQRATRSGSVSSTSSLSSVNDDVLLNTSTFNSPVKNEKKQPPQVSNQQQQDDAPSAANNPSDAMALQEMAVPIATPTILNNPYFASNSNTQFVSPYSSKENFEKVAAETLAGPPAGARIATPPIKSAPKAGPKTFLFSIHKPPIASAASASSPSSATNNPPNNNNHSTSAPEPKSTSTTTTRARSSMAPMIPNSTSTSTTATATNTPSGNPPTQALFKTKALNKVKAQTPPVPYDPNDSLNRKRRAARERTNLKSNADVSFERHQVEVAELESDVDAPPAKIAKKPPPRVRLNTRTRNANYESDDNSSPTQLSFQPELAPGSVTPSRAGTPNNFNRPTRKTKPGTGLRVKTSPMKKKGGTLAGLPRPSGERNSPSGGTNGAQEENDDYCSSCGGNGELVCCDGCTRAFHAQCIDPPMVMSELPDDPWFCYDCLFHQNPPQREPPNVFGALLYQLGRKNPIAFHLPLEVRERFEGVKTGSEGEYEEVVPPKSRANKPTFEEQPDYFRTKDAKGNLIVCFHCRKTATPPDRKIIPCTFCSNSWHLDCLPTPMAKEPGAGRQWRCPLHVDDLLSILPAALAPAHKFRKVKGWSAVRPYIPRGVRNNGHIEIENEPSDDEDIGDLHEVREYDQVYKVPDKTVKLDFLSKVKSTGSGITQLLHQRSQSSAPTIRSIEEQQAALNLASLAAQPGSGDNTNTLIKALLHQASPDVISMIAVGDASATANGPSLSDSNKTSLLAMKALIENALGTQPKKEAASPPAAESGVDTEMLL